MNHFNVTDLLTGTDLEIMRNRAQNKQFLRKGVDAIIEEYKKKWNDREDKRTRYNPAAASQGGGRQTEARRGPGRPPGRQQQGATTKYHTVFKTHAITKLEWKQR
jgi:hypothetical protein